MFYFKQEHVETAGVVFRYNSSFVTSHSSMADDEWDEAYQLSVLHLLGMQRSNEL